MKPGSKYWLAPSRTDRTYVTLPRPRIALCTLLGMLSCPLSEATGRWLPPLQAQEIILLSKALPLGDLYADMPDQTLHNLPYRHLREYLSDSQGIPHTEIIKALNQCKLYILDRTNPVEREGRPTRTFVDRNPSILLEGPCSFQLKDRKGDDVTIQLCKAGLTKCFTVVEKQGEQRMSGIRILLRIDRRSARNQPPSCDLSFYSIGVEWNLEGTLRWTHSCTPPIEK